MFYKLIIPCLLSLGVHNSQSDQLRDGLIAQLVENCTSIEFYMSLGNVQDELYNFLALFSRVTQGGL